MEDPMSEWPQGANVTEQLPLVGPALIIARLTKAKWAQAEPEIWVEFMHVPLEDLSVDGCNCEVATVSAQ